MSNLIFEIERLKSLVAGCKTVKLHKFQGQLWAAENILNQKHRKGVDEAEAARNLGKEISKQYQFLFETRKKIEGGDNESL